VIVCYTVQPIGVRYCTKLRQLAALRLSVCLSVFLSSDHLVYSTTWRSCVCTGKKNSSYRLHGSNSWRNSWARQVRWRMPAVIRRCCAFLCQQKHQAWWFV